jgi:hypothetical protein
MTGVRCTTAVCNSTHRPVGLLLVGDEEHRNQLRPLALRRDAYSSCGLHYKRGGLTVGHTRYRDTSDISNTTGNSHARRGNARIPEQAEQSGLRLQTEQSKQTNKQPGPRRVSEHSNGSAPNCWSSSGGGLVTCANISLPLKVVEHACTRIYPCASLAAQGQRAATCAMCAMRTQAPHAS